MSFRLKKYLDKNLWPMLILGSMTALVAFSFAVLHIATSNSSELVAPDYYARGYDLKKIAAREAATKATGWEVQVLPLSPENTGDWLVQVNVRDSAGVPVDSLAGKCALYRPSDKMLDIPATDLTFMGRGRYLCYLPRELEAGRWDAIVELSADSQHYLNSLPFMIQ